MPKSGSGTSVESGGSVSVEAAGPVLSGAVVSTAVVVSVGGCVEGKVAGAEVVVSAVVVCSGSLLASAQPLNDASTVNASSPDNSFFIVVFTAFVSSNWVTMPPEGRNGLHA